ncbi:toxin glutamine deamidase domain-containing protein [Streptomyces collinus]|uniref:toxin glutamine deamidase domain-containing protein n=1 Tax=Streptomyces collinus TaxID=42684 RepID=UPI002943D62A|nr:toxin glutamine deamidase domain-containing protein [Streptomyces collinus]
MTTAAVAPRTVPNLREVARQFPGWLRKHAAAALTSAVVGGVFGYVLNVWLIAVRYQGADKVPRNAPATSYGNFFQGALFWGLATTVLFGAFGYWHAVGTRQFLADLRGLPHALGGLLRGDRAAGVHLLWGAAVALLLAQVVSPSAGAVLAIGLLAGAPGLIGSIISAFVLRIWSALIRQIAPTRHQRITGITGMTVGLLGSATALVVAAFVSDSKAKYVLAGVLAGAAVLVTRIGRPSAPALVLLIIGTALLVHGLIDVVPAHANDGGTLECTGQAWLQCSGSGTVLRNSVVGGSAAAAGGILGSFIGDLAGTLGGGPDGRPGDRGPFWQPGPDTPPDDRKAISDWIQGLLDDPAFQHWRAAHPGFAGPPTDGEFNQYLNWRHAQGMEDPPLALPSQRAPSPAAAQALPPLPPGDAAALPPDLAPLPELPPGPGPLDVPPSGDAPLSADQPPGPADTAPQPAAAPQPPPAPPPAPDAGADTAQAIHNRIQALKDTNIYDDPDHPSHYWQRLQGLLDNVDPAKGLTPDQLKTVTDLENTVQTYEKNGLEARETVRKDGMTKLVDAVKQGTKADQDYTNYLHQLSVIEAHENYLNNQIDQLPPGQYAAANRTLQQIESAPPGSDTATQLRQLTTTVFHQTQLQSITDAAAAQQDALGAQQLANSAQTLEHIAIASGILVGPAAIAAGAATVAQVGAVNLVSQAVTGGTLGYQQGGVPGALWGVASSTLPVNTIAASVNALQGQGDQVSIAMGFVKDVMNAMTLSSVGVKNLGPAPAPSAPPGPGAPPAPPPVPQAASRTLGVEGITDIPAYLKDINPGGPSRQPLGYTKRGLFEPSPTDPTTLVPRAPGTWKPLTTGTNCPNTTIATDAKLAGVPLPPAPPGNGLSIAEVQKIYGKTFQPMASKTAIMGRLQTLGPGARGLVAAERSGGASGHVFNVVNDGGVVKFLDGQTGGPASFMERRFFFRTMQRYTKLHFMQTGS